MSNLNTINPLDEDNNSNNANDDAVLPPEPMNEKQEEVFLNRVAHLLNHGQVAGYRTLGEIEDRGKRKPRVGDATHSVCHWPLRRSKLRVHWSRHISGTRRLGFGNRPPVHG
ncbi:hypothetical protein BGZ83_001262 [Gryganskiella cystojenkinii]|nr:hypothetical protein BGZ83_001262 [Gryganskiella cystojenkinii]